MKKIVAMLLSLVMMFSLTSVAFAKEKDVTVEVNGRELRFDVKPKIISGRTMVPLRIIFEILGANVEWDDATQTVTATRHDDVVQLTIGKAQIIVNGNKKALDISPIVVSGRTLVPVRAVSEAFDAEVTWDGESKTVHISTDEHYTPYGSVVSIIQERGRRFDSFRTYEYFIQVTDNVTMYMVYDYGNDCLRFELRDGEGEQDETILTIPKEGNATLVMETRQSSKVSTDEATQKNRFQPFKTSFFTGKKTKTLMEENLVYIDNIMINKIGYSLSDFYIPCEVS